MRRSTNRRAATRPRFDRRLLGAAAAVVVFGGLIGVTQIAGADDDSGPEKVNGLEILANDCGRTNLAPHDGFQNGNRCVSTEFGEVGAAEKNPTLLITDAPRSVRAGEPFQLRVSTRNLVRDRFLAAGQGGYYVESSVLTPEGLVRGHFHTACRMLSSTREAVDPAPVPAFFVATEDRKGGAQPDTVTIQVPGLPDEGVAQCASWAGDGSHRVPMMQRANQTPAFDAVRIRVEGGNDDDNGNEQPPGDDNGNGNEQPPPGDGDGNGNEQPPPGDGDGNGNEQPPGDDDGNEQPPADGDDNGNEQPPPADGDQNPPPAQGGDGDGDEQPDPVVTRPATKATTKAAPAKSATTKAAQPADRDESEDEAEEEAAPAKPKPKPSATAKKGAVREQAAEDDAEEAPAAQLQSQDDVVAEPAPAPAPDDSRLALTGVNTIAIAGGGLLLVLAGVVLFGSVRRRRAEARWH